MPLPALYIYQSLLYVRMNRLILNENSHTHNYETRNKTAPKSTKRNYTEFHNSINYSGVILYNSLPNILKKPNCYNTFKKNLRKFILKEPVYSKDEFLINCKDQSIIKIVSPALL